MLDPTPADGVAAAVAVAVVVAVKFQRAIGGR
jgi:hypothetical protein